MAQYAVQYTAYESGSSNVVSEGPIVVTAETAYMAESTVRAMFRGCEVIIRYTNNA